MAFLGHGATRPAPIARCTGDVGQDWMRAADLRQLGSSVRGVRDRGCPGEDREGTEGCPVKATGLAGCARNRGNQTGAIHTGSWSSARPVRCSSILRNLSHSTSEMKGHTSGCRFKNDRNLASIQVSPNCNRSPRSHRPVRSFPSSSMQSRRRVHRASELRAPSICPLAEATGAVYALRPDGVLRKRAARLG